MSPRWSSWHVAANRRIRFVAPPSKLCFQLEYLPVNGNVEYVYLKLIEGALIDTNVRMTSGVSNRVAQTSRPPS